MRASDIPVLEVEASNGKAFERINAEVEQAIKTDKAEAIVLGCAGMAELGATLHDLHNIPVLDGISCAIKQVEAMIYLNLKNSNIGGYAKPRQK